MHVDLIREALHRQPFDPIVFRLVDGRSVPVPHPDFVALSRRRVIVVNPSDEKVLWLEPALILSIEYAGTDLQGAGTTPDSSEGSHP